MDQKQQAAHMILMLAFSPITRPITHQHPDEK